MQSNIIKSIIIIFLIIGTIVLKCQGNNSNDRNPSKIEKKEVKQHSMKGRSGINHLPILLRYKSKCSIPRAHRGQSNHVNTVALELPLSKRVLRKKRTHEALKLPKIQKKYEKRLSKIRSVDQSHLVSSRGIKPEKKPHKTKSKHNISYEKTHHLEKRSRIKHVKRKSEKNKKSLAHKVTKCSKNKLSIKEKEKHKTKRRIAS